MAEILNMEDYRRGPIMPEGIMMEVTLIGFQFKTPEGGGGSLTYTMRMHGEQVREFLDLAREFGGVVMQTNEANWLLPWPPAAVRIRPADEQNSASPQHD